MPKWGYSVIKEELDPEKTAKASGRELRVSHKNTREVCRAIKGMPLAHAKEYLKNVMDKTQPVPFTRYRKKAAHRHGIENAYAGRYPIKAAAKVLAVLKSAEANAENKGLDPDRLSILHAAAYPGMKIKRYTPRAQGRASPKYDTLTHIEIILTEKTTQGATP